MEKKKAHYNLEQVKTLIQQGDFEITKTAKDNAANDFRFFTKQIVQTVLSLEKVDLFKSMTTNKDNKLWQDVYYKKLINNQIAYIKFQIINENTLIIQFKEK